MVEAGNEHTVVKISQENPTSRSAFEEPLLSAPVSTLENSLVTTGDLGKSSRTRY